MFSTNKKWSIFIVFMVMSSGSESFRLQTEESLTAVRGGIISLPCTFSVPARAVYWYKHNFTGAPDDGASLVARDFFGFTDPLQGFERFSITNDYSLIVGNVTVHDETTYSCLVVEIDSERGYTDLRVIALAEPIKPIVESCNVTAPGRCIYHVYTVGENSPEDVTLVCMVYNVRPLPGLTWIRSDGRVPENATQQMQEKDGLFNISSQVQVTKADFDKQYTCEANGDAVNGTSSMKITIIEGDVATDSHDRGINKSLITSIIINFILLILFVSCLIYYKKCGSPGPLGAVKRQKPESLGDIESQPLTDQEELTVTKLKQKIESLEKERKGDRASFEEEKRAIESNWQKTVNDQVEKLMKTQELAMTELSQKVEALENERKKDRVLFEEDKLKIKSKWQKTVRDILEKLHTEGNPKPTEDTNDFDELLMTVAKRLRNYSEIYTLGRNLGFSSVEAHIYISANYTTQVTTCFGTKKMLRDWRIRQGITAVRDALKKALEKSGLIHITDEIFSSQRTVTKFSQEMEALEYIRERFQAIFEKKKLAIELKLKKHLQSLNENVDELENGKRSRGNPDPAEDTNDIDEILVTVAQRLRKWSDIETLGTNLEFCPRDIEKYKATNRTKNIQWIGTLKMLQDWRIRQQGQGVNTVRDALKKALEKSCLIHITDEIFPSQHTVTKLRQKIEVLENDRERYQAKFEKEKRAIELKWSKQAESLNENVDELENGNTSPRYETDDNRA